MLRQSGADTIAIGHGRAPASITAAQALHVAWIAAGGTVLTALDWPATAASWLRPARRLTTGNPDAWIIADTVADAPSSPAGWLTNRTGPPGAPSASPAWPAQTSSRSPPPPAWPG